MSSLHDKQTSNYTYMERLLKFLEDARGNAIRDLFLFGHDIILYQSVSS